MAVPFRRKSSTRIKKGRSSKNFNFQKRVLKKPIVKCSNCQKVKLLHRICQSCHVYGYNSKIL